MLFVVLKLLNHNVYEESLVKKSTDLILELIGSDICSNVEEMLLEQTIRIRDCIRLSRNSVCD